MAKKESVEKEISQLLSSLDEEGLLDGNFVLSQSVKKVGGAFAFLELISRFRSESQATIRTLTEELEQPMVDYEDMYLHGMKIKGSSSCIGARRMTLACGDLTQGITNRSKEDCVLALGRIRQEFQVMQDKFDLISQLERRLLSVEFE